MAVIGRIIGLVGWVWLALGLFGPAVGLDRVSIFPGIILLFVGRVVRRIPEQRDEGEPDQPVQTEPVPERMLNTDREQTLPVPRDVQEPVFEPVPVPVPLPEPTPPSDRDQLLSQILLAGGHIDQDPDAGDSDASSGTVGGDAAPRQSSADMIAQAHKRWNRS